MSRYRLTAQAQEDFEDIRRWYHEQRGAASARRIVQDLREQLRLVARNPTIGRPREELAPLDTFFWPHRRFFIIYLAETKPLEILRIWDASRGDPDLVR